MSTAEPCTEPAHVSLPTTHAVTEISGAFEARTLTPQKAKKIIAKSRTHDWHDKEPVATRTFDAAAGDENFKAPFRGIKDAHVDFSHDQIDDNLGWKEPGDVDPVDPHALAAVIPRIAKLLGRFALKGAVQERSIETRLKVAMAICDAGTREELPTVEELAAECAVSKSTFSNVANEFCEFSGFRSPLCRQKQRPRTATRQPGPFADTQTAIVTAE